jgi:hypothetical protein
MLHTVQQIVAIPCAWRWWRLQGAAGWCQAVWLAPIAQSNILWYQLDNFVRAG